MALPLELLRSISNQNTKDTWKQIFEYTSTLMAQPLYEKVAANEVTKRDRNIAALDHFLATAGWDMWRDFDSNVEHTSDALVNWWGTQTTGKAILILDALSLRELPWILSGASKHGLKVVSTRVTAAELPGDTTPFAKSLGFPQRSALENNTAGDRHRFPNARTECTGMPWQDCANLVGAEPNWVIWHHWPDSKIHELGVAGEGIESVVNDAAAQLNSDGFWALVNRLATGRKLIITSDHGYAATGLFPDSVEEQGKVLKELFKSGRWCEAQTLTESWVPPIAITIESRNGSNTYALGRRKWKSQGGYPTLAHGGLSVLEVAVPFVELTRIG